MGERAKWIGVVASVALLGAAGLALPGLTLETDITRFLPVGEDPLEAELVRSVARSDLNRTLTLSVEAPSAAVAAEAAGALASALRPLPEVAEVQAPGDEALSRAFYEAYFPRRLLFVTDRPDRMEEALSPARLQAHARSLRERLGLPTGPFVRRVAPEDPWLVFVRRVEAIQRSLAGDLVVRDGQLVTADGRHGIVVLRTVASPFDVEPQARLQRVLAETFAEVNAAHGGTLRLEQAGVHRIAVHTAEATEADVTRVGVAGTVFVLLFLLLLFRSPRLLFLGHVPLVLGIAAAFVVARLAFPRIHGLTLAFGASLVGVAIDYVAHTLNHHVLAPAPQGPWATVRRIAPGLVLGAATTVAGILGLAGASLPGVQQMAVFTAVGVSVAVVATLFVLPPWLPREPTPTRLHRRLADGVEASLRWARARERRVLSVLPTLALLVAGVGLASLRMDDDLRSLSNMDPALVAEDEAVRERVARVGAGRFVAAIGEDLEAALDRNDRAALALEEARGAGEVTSYRSLHELLWSARLQRENLTAVRAVRDAWPRTTAALTAEGFTAEGFGAFQNALEADPAPLTADALRDTPLWSLAAPFLVELEGGRVAVLTFVAGGDPAALATRLAGLDGVVVFDQRHLMREAYVRFRTSVLVLMGLGLVAVLLLVFARYRRVRPTLAVVAPAVLAGGVALGVAALVQAITLMHVMALLLVLSMGVDYGVFVVESREHPEGTAPTVVSLLVACVSTCLSFGALALSDQPALSALGLTATVGVLASLLLAPAAWLLLDPPARAGEAPPAEG